MKKILLSFCFFANLTSANTIDAIAIVVDKEPITTYDINEKMEKLHLSKNEALQVLINEKMEKSQMKKFGIFTSELELDNAIDKMLSQNNITLDMLKADLKTKGQTYEQFRENFKKDLEKRKLYDQIANTAKIDYSDIGAKKFFEQHQDKFSIFTEIAVKIYTSQNINFLESLKINKKTMLKAENAILTPENADPRLLSLLSQVSIGDFSPILNSKNGYQIYKVENKGGMQTPDFEQIKNDVLNAYIGEQRQNYIQDYFDKLRSKINIEYLR
ncbi:peptidylprolyl isomerase [Campylobacter molothri]|uniref:peptidylprolyl isomerase n=1 Tax=Campylobacter molothri TaxID=1032242 RepID=UPI0035AD9F13